MRNRLIPFVVTFLLIIAAAPAGVEASPYEVTLCQNEGVIPMQRNVISVTKPARLTANPHTFSLFPP